jgi:magnesium-transporting ATPase (P-type)
VKTTSGLVTSDGDCSALKGYIRCEQPNNSVSTFTGLFHLNGNGENRESSSASSDTGGVGSPYSSYATDRSVSKDGEDREDGEPLNIKNIVLRGVKLRNTPFVYGLVVNTGHETKIMQAVTKANFKRNSLEKAINGVVLKLLVLIFFLCLLGSTLNVVLQRYNGLLGTVH